MVSVRIGLTQIGQTLRSPPLNHQRTGLAIVAQKHEERTQPNQAKMSRRLLVAVITGRKRNIKWLTPFFSAPASRIVRRCGFLFLSIHLNINISLDHSGYSQL
jgi:hypothetical protein